MRIYFQNGKKENQTFQIFKLECPLEYFRLITWKYLSINNFNIQKWIQKQSKCPWTPDRTKTSYFHSGTHL